MLHDFAHNKQHCTNTDADEGLLLLRHSLLFGSCALRGILGNNRYAVLHGIDQRLNLWNQCVRILGGQLHLLCGEGNGHIVHTVHCLELCLDLSGAVGAVQTFQSVSSGGRYTADFSLSGNQGHAVFQRVHHCLHFGQQFVLIVGGDSQLPGGEGQGRKSDLRHGANLGFYFGGAVGTVQTLHKIDPLFHVLIGHLAGAFGKALAADIAVFRVGVALGTVAVLGMTGGMVMLHYEMGMGTSGHILGFVVAVSTAAAIPVLVVMVMVMIAAAIMVVVVMMPMLMVVTAAVIMFVVVMMLMIVIMTAAAIMTVLVMMLMLMVVTAAARIMVVMVVLVLMVMPTAAIMIVMMLMFVIMTAVMVVIVFMGMMMLVLMLVLMLMTAAAIVFMLVHSCVLLCLQ